jgi:hypothetical protein
MSEDQAKIYHLSHGADVVAQLIQIKDKSKKAGKFAEYITIFEEALLRLQRPLTARVKDRGFDQCRAICRI